MSAAINVTALHTLQAYKRVLHLQYRDNNSVRTAQWTAAVSVREASQLVLQLCVWRTGLQCVGKMCSSVPHNRPHIPLSPRF